VPDPESAEPLREEIASGTLKAILKQLGLKGR
jgi:hypothetical protein